jgi:hypothetical protein
MNTEKTRAELGSKALLARTIYVDDESEKLADALAVMTDAWIDNGQYCAQTVIDMRDALLFVLRANAPADQTATSGMVRRDVGQCEDCDGTGWYGDNGPGIIGNSEFVRCDCGTGEKCMCGYHPYIEVGGYIPWCEICNREADMDICRINHVLPNDSITGG